MGEVLKLAHDALRVDNHFGTCECTLVIKSLADSFGVRLKAGHQFLVLIIEVRILYPELPPNPGSPNP
jgi:hypothetical protein